MHKFRQVSPNVQEITIDNENTANEKLVWVNITNAGKKEIEYLRKKFNFNLIHLRASSSKIVSQRPIISEGAHYFFLILHFPVIKDGRLISSEIDFFISHGHLTTLHNGDIGALNDFFKYCKKDGDAILAHKFESSAVLLYEILEKVMLYCFSLLDNSSQKIDKIEERIFAGQVDKNSASDILSLRRDLINFRRIMQNHKNILKKLMEMESSIVPTEDIRKYYKELIEHSKRIWEILENQKEMVDALYQTNESLLNYRLTDVMKTLTIFSVIVFPLTLLAAIFSMRLKGMPLLDNSNGFWIVVTVMIFLSLSMLLFFERKKWL